VARLTTSASIPGAEDGLMTRALARTIVPLVFMGSISLPAAVGQRAAPAPAVIALELEGRHVIVQATVNKSRPLSFVLDTGADRAIIRTDVAKELGLKLEGQINGRGAGPGVQSGSFVRNATWSLVGLTGFSQPMTLALPLPAISAAMGRSIDGIVGGEFIKQFVVELDYQAKLMRLHTPATFTYSGAGETVPIDFIEATHPTIAAKVTPVGGRPIEGRFMFDIGSGLALALHSPFVRTQKLLDGGLPTIRAIGSAGAGGKVAGRVGRVESLQIGSFTLSQPFTMFAQDDAGAFANAALAGNIGAQIAMRFHIFLDYSRRRMILEPTPGVRAPFDRAFAGFALRASGSNFRTLRITEILEKSPASDAGLEVGDELTAIDGVSVEQLSLSAVNEMFEKPVRYTLTIRRGDRTQDVVLTPARLF
jgi:hypothetical protein